MAHGDNAKYRGNSGYAEPNSRRGGKHAVFLFRGRFSKHITVKRERLVAKRQLIKYETP